MLVVTAAFSHVVVELVAEIAVEIVESDVVVAVVVAAAVVVVVV